MAPTSLPCSFFAFRVRALLKEKRKTADFDRLDRLVLVDDNNKLAGLVSIEIAEDFTLSLWERAG
jgi:hypothetical protein